MDWSPAARVLRGPTAQLLAQLLAQTARGAPTQAQGPLSAVTAQLAMILYAPVPVHAAACECVSLVSTALALWTGHQGSLHAGCALSTRTPISQALELALAVPMVPLQSVEGLIPLQVALLRAVLALQAELAVLHACHACRGHTSHLLGRLHVFCARQALLLQEERLHALRARQEHMQRRKTRARVCSATTVPTLIGLAQLLARAARHCKARSSVEQQGEPTAKLL